MIIVDSDHGPVELHRFTMRQTMSGGIYREVTRKEVRMVFGKRKRYMMLGRYGNPGHVDTWERLWPAYYFRTGPRQLNIGCIRFDADATMIIRHWAYAATKAKRKGLQP